MSAKLVGNGYDKGVYIFVGLDELGQFSSWLAVDGIVRLNAGGYSPHEQAGLIVDVMMSLESNGNYRIANGCTIRQNSVSGCLKVVDDRFARFANTLQDRLKGICGSDKAPSRRRNGTEVTERSQPSPDAPFASPLTSRTHALWDGIQR